MSNELRELDLKVARLKWPDERFTPKRSGFKRIDAMGFSPTTRWEDAGPLLAEMPAPVLERNTARTWLCCYEYPHCFNDVEDEDHDGVAPTPTEAITRAWLAWKESSE